MEKEVDVNNLIEEFLHMNSVSKEPALYILSGCYPAFLPNTRKP